MYSISELWSGTARRYMFVWEQYHLQYTKKSFIKYKAYRQG